MESTHIDRGQVFLQKKCQIIPDTPKTEVEDNLMLHVMVSAELSCYLARCPRINVNARLPVTLVFSTVFNFFTPKKLPDKNFIKLLNTSTLSGSFLLLCFVNVAIYVYDICIWQNITYNSTFDK